MKKLLNWLNAPVSEIVGEYGGWVEIVRPRWLVILQSKTFLLLVVVPSVLLVSAILAYSQ